MLQKQPGKHKESVHTEITVARQMRKLKEETGIDLVAKRFRKAFSCALEQVGASEEIINVRQWRGQSGVLYKNYIKYPNRAVSLCGPFIDRMFGEGIAGLREVK
jgi:hypothetical protein